MLLPRCAIKAPTQKEKQKEKKCLKSDSPIIAIKLFLTRCKMLTGLSAIQAGTRVHVLYTSRVKQAAARLLYLLTTLVGHFSHFHLLYFVSSLSQEEWRFKRGMTRKARMNHWCCRASIFSLRRGALWLHLVFACRWAPSLSYFFSHITHKH